MVIVVSLSSIDIQAQRSPNQKKSSTHYVHFPFVSTERWFKSKRGRNKGGSSFIHDKKLKRKKKKKSVISHLTKAFHVPVEDCPIHRVDVTGRPFHESCSSVPYPFPNPSCRIIRVSFVKTWRSIKHRTCVVKTSKMQECCGLWRLFFIRQLLQQFDA